jgi:uncharacterized protein
MKNKLNNNLDSLSLDLKKKYSHLQEILQSMGKVLVAFSGGVDSTLLLKAAKDVLGNNVQAVFATSEIYPEREKKEALEIAHLLHVNLKIIKSKEMQNPDFRKNPPQRCYYCKMELFSQLKEIAAQAGMPFVIDGANFEDLNDYRPGSKAAEKLGIRSPLKEAVLVKKEIRDLLRSLGLPNWNKPSMACLASRFPYDHPLNPEDLTKVAAAEEFLFSLGFTQIRVRHHGNIARIEVLPEDIPRFTDKNLREKITKKLHDLGYTYVTLDLTGYRTGSLNESLPLNIKNQRRSRCK